MATKLATAQWDDPALVAEKYLYRDGGVWLGRSATNDNLPLGYQDDRHVCLVSGTRGGKGTSSIINTLLVYPGSVVVIDPKGENATVTAARRGRGTVLQGSGNAGFVPGPFGPPLVPAFFRGLGQAVHVLDPFHQAQIDPRLRSRFNPLDALDPQDPQSVNAASRLADALIVVHHESNDPYWDKAARRMIKGLILHVLTAPEYEGRRNLLTVRDLIARGDWESVEALQEMGETEIASPEALLWDQLQRNPAFKGAVARIGSRFSSLLLHAPKTFEGVVENVSSNFEFLESPSMEECLSASDFNVDDLKLAKDGMSLFLCLPEYEMGTHHGWLRMMIALVVAQMQIVKERPATGFPVLMILDEFAGLDRMKTIEHAVAQIAGAGVKLFFVLQSLEQLKAVYKDNWETFLANAGVKIFFNLEDHFSREYVSKLIGDTEIIRVAKSKSATAGVSDSSAHSASKSVSKSEGLSSSRSRSESQGTNYSSGQSESTGTNESFSSGTSFTLGETHTPGLFGSGLFSSMISGSNSKGWSDSRSSSTSQGWTRSSSSGRSEGWGRALTEGENSSTGLTEGESFTSTKGTSSSSTAGVSETIQRRPLIHPDEIGQFFATIRDKRFRDYPGLALVLIAGERPIYLRRSYYYEDGYFIGLFSKHPDHEMPPIALGQIQRRTFKNEWVFSAEHEFRITLSEGTSVQEGQAIGGVYEWPGGRPQEIREVAAIRSPWEGKLIRSLSLVAEWGIMHYAGDNFLTDLLGNPYRDADKYFQDCADKKRAYLKGIEDANERRKQQETEEREKAEALARFAQAVKQLNLSLSAHRTPPAPPPTPEPNKSWRRHWLLRIWDRVRGR
jgi:type IV secretory pathway TraG/TraD family ATPase VirD4